MKKRFAGILMCMMMLCMSLLAGCSLVERDYNRYYSQAVAVVEHKENGKTAQVTKRELIEGYQSYGYMYEQSYGYTREEALSLTLSMLENRKITLLEAEEKFGVSENGKNGLTSEEQTYLYDQVVDALSSNLDVYYNEVTGTTSSEEESEDITFEGYDKTAVLEFQNGQYVIRKTQTTEDPLADYKFDSSNPKNFFDSEDYKAIYENFRENILGADEDYQKAFLEYARALRLSEYGQNLSTDTPSLFDREIQRLYNLSYENYMITKYSYSNRNSSDVSSITTSDILNMYSSKVRADYTEYVIEGDSGYDEDMQNSLNEMYYIRQDSEATKFFTVANVLFKFTDEQQEEYDAIVALSTDDGGLTSDQINQRLDRLYAQITPVVRTYNENTDIYEEVENHSYTISYIYNIMSSALSSAKATGNVNYIGDTINDFIYQYNEDTGMFNATNNYVIGIDSEGEVVSSFVDSFNEAAVALYDNGNGQIGDISGFVRSEYGIHVLIYTGACENLFDSINVSDKEALEKLYDTRVNILVDKTYFDVIYDEIYVDNYTYFENNHMRYLRQEYTITEYQGRYDDLLG